MHTKDSFLVYLFVVLAGFAVGLCTPQSWYPAAGASYSQTVAVQAPLPGAVSRHRQF